MVLNHFLAQAGICSRRKAVELIKARHITVNGSIIVDPTYQVQPSDSVKFKKRLVKLEDKVYLLLNKPKGFVSTTADERGRNTVLDLVSIARTKRLFPIGRLDKDTTGLIVLTNDGELAQKLAHPRYIIKKVYEVTLDNPLTAEQLRNIKKGIRLRDGIANVDTATFPDPKNKRIVRLGLHSGKKHIIRLIAEALGTKVRKLDRINYAGLTKKGLKIGTWRFLNKNEIEKLKS